MSDNATIAIWGFAGVVVTQVGLVILGIINGNKATRSEKQSKANAVKLEDLKIEFNGHMAKLIELKEDAAERKGRAAGEAKGTADEKARTQRINNPRNNKGR